MENDILIFEASKSDYADSNGAENIAYIGVSQAEIERITKKLKNNGQFEEALEDIRSWHSDCQHGEDGECEIYDAIHQGTKSDEEILKIACKVDMELVEKYLNVATGRQRRTS